MNLTDALFKRLAHHAEFDVNLARVLEAVPVTARHYGAGDIVVAQGEEAASAFVVSEGWAARTMQLSDGRTQIVNFMLPGDMFDLQVLVGQPCDHEVRALTPLTVACLGRDALMDLVCGGSHLVPALWWASVREESMLREQVLRNGRRSARERVAHLMLELNERLAAIGEADEEGFALPVGQSALADALGLSYVHVSRVLSHLEKEGLLVRRRSMVRIEDRKALQKMCDFSVVYLNGQKQAPRLALQ